MNIGLSLGLTSRRAGPALGPELVVNGDFATDSDWTKGVGWAITGGEAVMAAPPGGARNLSQDILTVGKTYEVKFTCTRTAGGLIVYAGISGQSLAVYASGTYTATLTAAGNTMFYLQANSAFVGTVDNVSVREVL